MASNGDSQRWRFRLTADQYATLAEVQDESPLLQTSLMFRAGRPGEGNYLVVVADADHLAALKKEWPFLLPSVRRHDEWSEDDD